MELAFYANLVILSGSKISSRHPQSLESEPFNYMYAGENNLTNRLRFL